MAKSLRSKIKRKFRTELRKRIGVPHQAQQEAKIQENLKKAIESQGGGKSVADLKKLMGSSAVPVATSSAAGTDAAKPATDDVAMEAASKKDKKKRAKKPRRKKTFVHFHTLRKKGV